MVFFSDLDKFINDNKSKIKDDSLLLLIDGDKFSFIRVGIGYLNITGSYEYILNGQELFTDLPEDGVLSLWCINNGGRILKNNDSKEDDLWRLRYNMVYDGRGSEEMTLEGYRKSSNVNPDSILTSIGFDDKNAFAFIKGFELLEKPTLKYRDSYGHETIINYKYNCIGIQIGDNFERNFAIKKFEKFRDSRIKKSDRI